MKKILVVFLFAGLFMSVNAQGNKQYGPVAGNYAVGISANPFLEYVGNFFGKSSSNIAPTANISRYNVSGKYFLSDNSAVRAGLGFGGTYTKSFLGNEDQNIKIDRGLGIYLALGLEKRIGNGRIQAFYGPSVGLNYLGNTDVYKYEEEPVAGTKLKETAGREFGLGIGGFGGIECFITQNIAIGTELGLGLLIESKGKSKTEYQDADDVLAGSKYTKMSFEFYDVPAQLSPKGKIFFLFYF
ncbi:MAG: hypothetical protein PF436_07735 [Prolixibacteraceae bacterium]|jgi:hypothetical protein|nr:hypothetical protein [Prolixibacteraceae bacterium]